VVVIGADVCFSVSWLSKGSKSGDTRHRLQERTHALLPQNGGEPPRPRPTHQLVDGLIRMDVRGAAAVEGGGVGALRHRQQLRGDLLEEGAEGGGGGCGGWDRGVRIGGCRVGGWVVRVSTVRVEGVGVAH